MKERQRCFIVKDLLESYDDGLVSQETGEMIHFHLHSCIACQKAHEKMQIRRQEEEVMKQQQGSRFKRTLMGYQVLGFLLGVLLAIGIVVAAGLLLILWTKLLMWGIQLL